MLRILLFTLFFGVIDYGFSVRISAMRYPRNYYDDYNNERRQEFHELFSEVADSFIEADVARRSFGLKEYNAQDIYTADEYKRIYPFQDYFEDSIEIIIKNRVMKVSARSMYTPREDLQDIVILVDHLLISQLSYYVDYENAVLIINIPFIFKKSGAMVCNYNEFECCDMRPYIR
ncbi:unnamed protein product, partial [Brenthis ino]